MTAAINPLNTVRGPANVWIATLGTTEPAQTNAALVTDPGAGWTFVGATQGGVNWIDDQTVTDIEADQVADPIGGRVTKRRTTVTFSMLEATLASLQIALNRMGTLTVGAGITTYSPGQPNAATIPTYSAVLVDGQAPQLTGGGEARRRAIFRKVLSTGGKITVANDPSKDGLFAVTLQCYAVSNSIDPWVAMDQTS